MLAQQSSGARHSSICLGDDNRGGRVQYGVLSFVQSFSHFFQYCIWLVQTRVNTGNKTLGFAVLQVLLRVHVKIIIHRFHESGHLESTVVSATTSGVRVTIPQPL
jgi:hypothetical protein